LLASKSQVPLPLAPELVAALERLETPSEDSFTAPGSRFGVLWLAVRSIRHILMRSIAWRVLSSLVVLGGVLFATRIIKPGQPLSLALLFGLAFMLSKFIDAAIEYFDSLRRAQINRIVQAELMRLVNRKLADIDPDSLRLFSKGELKTLVSSDVEAVEDFITAAVQQIVPALIILVILGPAIIVISGASGAVALIAAVLVTPFVLVGALGTEFFQKRAQSQQDKLSSSIGEWVRNIRLVRFLGWNDFFQQKVAGIMQRFTLLFAARHAISCIMGGVTHSWWMVPIIAMLTFAHLTGVKLSLVQLFSSVWLLDHLVTYLGHLNHSISMFGAASASAERLRRLWSAPALRDRLTTSINHEELTETSAPIGLSLVNVTVKIGEKTLLHDLSIDIDLRKRTAVVGSVGSGKSLFLELLVGERPANFGVISVIFSHGLTRPPIKVPLWSREGYDRYREYIAYAPQSPYLSNNLIRNNIELSSNVSDLTLERVRIAAHKAQLTADIASFSRGMNEEIGETGINLSGGQKQRVSLARAFMSQRNIMLLDDPLSAVDRDTEQRLMHYIIQSNAGLVLVSHRLNELKSCDRVLVIEDGKIVEDGTYDELAQHKSSQFSRLLAAGELS